MKEAKFKLGDKVTIGNKPKVWIITRVQYAKRIDSYTYDLEDEKGKENRQFWYEKQLKEAME